MGLLSRAALRALQSGEMFGVSDNVAARMARADQHFPIGAFRATRGAIRDEPAGPEFWAMKPETANTYLPEGTEGAMITPGRLSLGERSLDVDMGGRAWHELRFDDVPDPDLRAALGPGSVPMTVAREAQNRGYDSIVFRNIVDNGPANPNSETPDTVIAVLKPNLRRSRNAMFDPARLSESDLLAGVGGAFGGAGLLGAARRHRQREGA